MMTTQSFASMEHADRYKVFLDEVATGRIVGPVSISPPVESQQSASFVTDIMDIELAMRSFADDASEHTGQALLRLLARSRDAHVNSPTDQVAALAHYHAHAVSLLANGGIKKLALGIARELKNTEPFASTGHARMVLNPETFVLYGEPHAAFDATPISDLHSRPPSSGLFATDLSGTMYLSGRDPDIEVFDALRRWVRETGVHVAYITGKSFMNAWDAITRYALPVPHFIASEVGTRVYHYREGEWRESREWDSIMSARWMPEMLRHMDEIVLELYHDAYMPPFSQGMFMRKFRIERPAQTSVEVYERIHKRLAVAGIGVSLAVALQHDSIRISFLPVGGSKVGALDYISQRLGLGRDHVAFSGDSGTEYEALISGVRGIFVGTETALAEKLAHYPTVYRSAASGPRGILDGLRHYGLLM